MELDPKGLEAAMTAYGLDVVVDGLEAAIAAYLAATQPQAGEAVGYVTPDSIAEVAAGRIGNHLFPKGTLHPENEIPVYASPQPASPAQGVTDEALDSLSPEESIGAFDGSGQWIEVCTVAEFRQITAAIGAGGQAVAWHPLTYKDGKMTCPMPSDETVVGVMLEDGTVCPAWYSCNIMDAGDWDFMPVKDDGEPDDGADSLASRVVAWRALSQPHPADERACTCHPDDNPPNPCAKKYALSECREAADQRVDPTGGVSNKAEEGRQCATECCDKPATVLFERGGVGSYYCHDCYMRVQALAALAQEGRS